MSCVVAVRPCINRYVRLYAVNFNSCVNSQIMRVFSYKWGDILKASSTISAYGARLMIFQERSLQCEVQRSIKNSVFALLDLFTQII